KMAKVKQTFDDTEIEDVSTVLNEEFQKKNIGSLIKPGMQIAVAVGSRGLDRLVEMTKVTIDVIKQYGGEPFIVPCMGSHGGATAEGQKAVLEHLGVKEEVVGAEIRSS